MASRKLNASRLTRRTFLAGSAAVAAGSLAAPRVARAAPPVIRYATASIIGPGELETVVMCDWFQKNVLKRYGKDYTIEQSTARGTPGTATLLAANQADIGTSAFPVFATIIQKGTVQGGVMAIAEVHRDGVEGYASNPYFVLENSPIKTVADFKGKTVAVNGFGTSVDIVLRLAAKQAGLDPKADVRVVEMPFANIGAALRQGRIDVGTLAMPFQVDEMAKGGVRKVADAVGVIAPYPILFQLARTDFLKKNADAVRAWLADYVEAQEWIYNPANRAKAVEVTADLMKSDPKSLDTYFLTNKDFKREINPCMPTASMQTAVDAMYDLGFLPARADIRPYIDNSYLPRACPA